MDNKNCGFILINKPIGPTSHDIIYQFRKITGIKKIGHAGTLDPFASGVLIVAISREATREIDKFVKLDKEYIATLHFGYTSDTFDRTGRINPWPKEVKKITLAEVKVALAKFIGEQEQIPPMFSAKKIKGKKLYELARQGKTIERQPSRIKIYDIKLLKYTWPFLEIKIKCSSGTYIRALANDIGSSLGCGAYLEELERTAIGEFKIDKAVEMDGLTKEAIMEKLFFSKND
jgi:tRNA pseudouridine55 synthase